MGALAGLGRLSRFIVGDQTGCLLIQGVDLPLNDVELLILHRFRGLRRLVICLRSGSLLAEGGNLARHFFQLRALGMGFNLHRRVVGGQGLDLFRKMIKLIALTFFFGSRRLTTCCQSC